jgi:hypothetical protein
MLSPGKVRCELVSAWFQNREEKHEWKYEAVKFISVQGRHPFLKRAACPREVSFPTLRPFRLGLVNSSQELTDWTIQPGHGFHLSSSEMTEALLWTGMNHPRGWPERGQQDYVHGMQWLLHTSVIASGPVSSGFLASALEKTHDQITATAESKATLPTCCAHNLSTQLSAKLDWFSQWGEK